MSQPSFKPLQLEKALFAIRPLLKGNINIKKMTKTSDETGSRRDLCDIENRIAIFLIPTVLRNGIKEWNLLEQSFKDLKSFLIFKQRIKERVFS